MQTVGRKQQGQEIQSGDGISTFKKETTRGVPVGVRVGLLAVPLVVLSVLRLSWRDT